MFEISLKDTRDIPDFYLISEGSLRDLQPQGSYPESLGQYLFIWMSYGDVEANWDRHTHRHTHRE